MIPYYYHIFYTPVYIPADDRGANLTGAEFVGLIIFLVILATWTLAVILTCGQLLFDDNKQDKKRHAIELIVLVAIGVIALGVVDVVNGGKTA